MNKLVFVYGTLQSSFNNTMARMLRENAEFLGKAYAYGLLFDLGDYPGAVFINDSDRRIYGELYEINRNTKEVINALDRYEGIDDPEIDLYIKKTIDVYFSDDDKRMKAFAYHYTKAFNDLSLIENGIYINNSIL